MALFLCLQLVNICVYIPSWMYPGTPKADLTESVVELLLEGIMQDSKIMSDNKTDDSSSYPTLNEEILMEDLHPAEESILDFSLFANALFGTGYYHYNTDIKTHVLSVVSPPPDFC